MSLLRSPVKPGDIYINRTTIQNGNIIDYIYYPLYKLNYGISLLYSSDTLKYGKLEDNSIYTDIFRELTLIDKVNNYLRKK